MADDLVISVKAGALKVKVTKSRPRINIPDCQIQSKLSILFLSHHIKNFVSKVKSPQPPRPHLITDDGLE